MKNIIDFHTHIFPDELAPRAIATLIANSSESVAHTNGTLSGLLNSMDENQIMRSVILPIATKPSQVSLINRSCNNLKSNKIIPFGTLHPLTTNIEEEVLYLKQNNISGIKFHPEYQNFYIDDRSVFPLYEQLEVAGLIVVFHAGKDPGPFTCDHALPEALKSIHQNFPELKMVAAHMGGWKLWDEVLQVLCGQSIYLDTSAVSNHLSIEHFKQIVHKHGFENILFGTDSPWFNQGDVVSWIMKMDFTEAELEMIFWKNAERLLNRRISD
jgi:predicted TIM-barrel fold metal-dependent hydrolase